MCCAIKNARRIFFFEHLFHNLLLTFPPSFVYMHARRIDRTYFFRATARGNILTINFQIGKERKKFPNKENWKFIGGRRCLSLARSTSNNKKLLQAEKTKFCLQTHLKLIALYCRAVII